MRRLFIAVSILFLSGLAQAAPESASSIDSLRRFFSGVQTFNARFRQVVLDEGMNTIQESSGTLWIDRPDKFRWDYDSPYKQEIVGDGRKIWMYDKDLQQVTVRPLAGGLGYTPAMLLAGRGRLEDNFAVNSLGMQGSLDWAQLVPKNKDGGFEKIRLGFENGKLKVLEMLDGFGNTTRVTLQASSENSKIDPSKFHFTPPQGVDVVDE